MGVFFKIQKGKQLKCVLHFLVDCSHFRICLPSGHKAHCSPAILVPMCQVLQTPTGKGTGVTTVPQTPHPEAADLSRDSDQQEAGMRTRPQPVL